MARMVYACATDWAHEICEASDLEGKMPLFSSIEELKSKRSCWIECGIVELKIEKIRYIEKPNYRLSAKSNEDT